MSIAKRPSKITLPAKAERWTTVLDFLIERFSNITKAQWQQRIYAGKVHWQNGTAIQSDTPYNAGKVVCYYREVSHEPVIPFEHKLIFRNEHILVIDKPHFLQVTPGGQFVNECLLARLQRELEQEDIVPVHRLDRDTAGLVMFSINPESRPQYFKLFADQKVTKRYVAVANLKQDIKNQSVPIHWQVANRIKASAKSRVQQQITVESPDQINARSDLSLIKTSSDIGLFQLTPHTGKTHQLRLHMMSIGMPILNDRFYPILKPREQAEDYNMPLQLLAQSLSFDDPISGKTFEFHSQQRLKHAPV